MSSAAVIFFLSLVILLLTGIVLYQRFSFYTGVRKQLQEISRKLEEILDTDSSEPVLVFTGNTALTELAAQINRLLEHHRKVNADYLRSRNAAKKMLANISHDIKTPMTVILGYLEIMRLNGTGTGEMIVKTEQKAKNVMELISQFFTLAKLESGDTELSFSPIDVCGICRESILDFYEILTARNFQVELSIPETPVRIRGDREALQRILSNLISNSIRYGSDGSYLAMAVRTGERAVCIDVTDRGKGIEPPFADRIFDRLFTLEDAGNRNIRGNGLGLAIAKNLALQLGGTITLKSTPYVNTTFTVKFPKLSAAKEICKL